jgi:small subunit ribosomal protein S3Ae
MAKVVIKSKQKKVKKKFPVEIYAPEFLNSVKLGESEVTDLNNLIGKTSKINLMYITKSIKNQNIRLGFKITEVSSGKANTQVFSYMQIPYYLTRFLKSGSDLVEDSFVVETKDKVKVRVKPFIVTKDKTTQLIKKSIRASTKEIIENDAKSKTYDEFISSVIYGKIQNSYRTSLKKIYPLKTFEFRKVEIEQ